METFSFNKIRFGVGLIAFLWLAWATAQDNRELKTNRHEVAIEAVLTLAVAASLVWLVTVRLQLGEHGLTYRSLTGTRAIHWREVSTLFISWRQRYLARVTIGADLQEPTAGGWKTIAKSRRGLWPVRWGARRRVVQNVGTVQQGVGADERRHA
jgi:hypothetical protein